MNLHIQNIEKQTKKKPTKQKQKQKKKKKKLDVKGLSTQKYIFWFGFFV